MKIKNIIARGAIAMAACAASVAASATAVIPAWPEITAESRPGTRWWWLGSAVDSVNLSALLHEYSRAGIGTVEITPIYGVQGNEDRDIPFLSDRWMKELRNVYDISSGCGILVDMNQGTGWPFGGAEVGIDDAACKIVFLIDTVTPGTAPQKTLPEKEQGIARFLAENRRSLSDGREEVLRAWQSRTMQKVKRAAPGGEGLVLDHFDRGAVSRYLDKFDRAFSRTSTVYPHCFFNDSYEVYNANWTPSLPDEFRKRRGYDILDHLAELIGTVDDGNNVLADYRRTLGELLLENFTTQWADRAHAHGTMVRNQAHGSPANLIDVYAAVDIPEIEGFGLSDFGIKGLRTDPGHIRPNYSDVSMLKYASSAAHITGKPLASSETLTWLTEHFRTSLSQMKPDIDLMFTCGVNRIFFHGTAYSPVDEPWPGWKFYASVDISPTNTIWRDVSCMNEYIARCQSMLQCGEPDNDFLVYLPIHDLWHQRRRPGEKGLLMTFAIENMREQAPEFIGSVMCIDSLGYDCDYISDRYLMSTTYTDGMLQTASTGSLPPARYKALIIPSGRASLMPPQLEAHLDSLRVHGATIIYGIDSVAMKQAATPETMRTDLGLRAIRRSTGAGSVHPLPGGDGYFYFIANLSPADTDTLAALAVDFADAVWFDPMTGDILPVQTCGGKIRVNLRSGESRILRTFNETLAPSRPVSICIAEDYAQNAETSVMDLSHNTWTLSMPADHGGQVREWTADGLCPWTAIADTLLRDYGGTIVYSTEFSIDGDPSGEWLLDLGDVRESAGVSINGRYIGTAWAVPFTLPCTDALRPGKNTIEISVTNLPANRIAALDRDSVPWRRFKEINFVDIDYKHTTYEKWPVMPSGLNSAVKLVNIRHDADRDPDDSCNAESPDAAFVLSAETLVSPAGPSDPSILQGQTLKLSQPYMDCHPQGWSHWSAPAEPLDTWGDAYTRAIGNVLHDVELRFGVEIKVETDTSGVTLAYADSRIRPYSVEETLDNILKPLDLRWERKGRNRFVVRSFDYPRRTFAEGEKMIGYLNTLYADRHEWEARRDTLVPDVRRRLGIDEMLAMRVEDATPVLSKIRKHDGYSTQNFSIETLPGIHVCGTIYAPSGKGAPRRSAAGLPLIICPNGHFANGRYNEAQQLRMGTLARMGAVCVDYDLVGWGESALELGEDAHRTALANTLQILNGITVLDHMIARGDIDTSRIGVNGASGGGTQVITLALVDPRYTAACPVVSLAAHFDGGCPCESGRRITLAASGTCHPEIAACFAPRPMGLVSDGGDWTARVPEVEYPYLQRIYGFYGAEGNVSDVHLPDERHDFGPNKRQAVYDFFARVFGLDASRIDESRVTIESVSELTER